MVLQRQFLTKQKKNTYYRISRIRGSGNYLVVATEPDPNKKPPANVTVQKGLSWVEVTSNGVEYGDMPNNLIGDNFICTPDGYVIFQNNGMIAKFQLMIW